MTRFYRILLIAVSVLSPLGLGIAQCVAATLPPVQTVNFDFGAGPAYAGDDGVISSPGGTFWNAVTANGLGICCGGPSMMDEFRQPTKTSLFAGDFSSWNDTTSPSNQGPRSDAIKPSSSTGAMLVISRVRELQELIIYINSPIGSTGPLNHGGGFALSWWLPLVMQPFSYSAGSGAVFPGSEGNDYLRFTTAPLGSGLGEAPTITIVLEDPSSTIAAIQIRGRFRGLPEPSSLALLFLGSSAVLLRRGLLA